MVLLYDYGKKRLCEGAVAILLASTEEVRYHVRRQTSLR